jgi:hypothetical protein
VLKIKEIIRKIEQSKDPIEKLSYINNIRKELQILEIQLKIQIKK